MSRTIRLLSVSELWTFDCVYAYLYNVHTILAHNLVRMMCEANERMFLLSKFGSVVPTVLANGGILRYWWSSGYQVSFMT